MSWDPTPLGDGGPRERRGVGSGLSVTGAAFRLPTERSRIPNPSIIPQGVAFCQSLWYNSRMTMTKRQLETSLAELQDTVKSAFGQVAGSLDKLFADELALALGEGTPNKRSTIKERAAARRYLIDSLMKLTEVQDLNRTVLDDLTSDWEKVTIERHVDATSTPDSWKDGDNVINGASEWVLPGGDTGDSDSPTDGGRG